MRLHLPITLAPDRGKGYKNNNRNVYNKNTKKQQQKRNDFWLSYREKVCVNTK